jgi:hypothetical protein
MARISSTHPMRVALLACVAAVLASLSLLPTTARAGLVEQVTGQVNEVVSPVVQAVPTVPQVKATVTTTAQAVTAKVTPPPPAKAEPTSEPPSKAVEEALHAVTERAETATGAALPAAPVQASPPAVVEPEDPVVDPPSVADSTESATAAAAPAEPPTAAARTTFVPAPAKNGSTGSPLPHWVAYVWPAVALTGPDLVRAGEHLGHALAQLVPDLPAGGEGGVAGVHASGGRPEAAASSSPLFARLPSEIGHAFSSVPTPLFVYLGLLALAVIAVALAVRREIGAGRRSHGPW